MLALQSAFNSEHCTDVIESSLEPVESKYNNSRVNDEDVADGCEEEDTDLDI
jgi:hypothetical protein